MKKGYRTEAGSYDETLDLLDLKSRGAHIGKILLKDWH